VYPYFATKKCKLSDKLFLLSFVERLGESLGNWVGC
jgi:hypothetical protein